MNEEINKDNYVLNDIDIENLKQAFDAYKDRCSLKYKKQIINMINKLSFKINKLNDWYKNTHLEKIKTELETEFAKVEEENEYDKTLIRKFSLRAKEIKILKMRFAIQPYNKFYTFQEIAEEINLTKERISQIFYRAIKNFLIKD